MRSEAIAIVLSLGLAAAPAWAGPGQVKGQSPGGEDLGGAQAQSPANDEPGANGQIGGLQSEDALKKSLQQAGFTDLQIAAGSYVVHAKGPDGKPVVLMITPDSIAVAKPQTAELPDMGQNGDESDGGAQDQDQDNNAQPSDDGGNAQLQSD